VKEATLHRSENVMHHKETQLENKYYKKIGVEILKYDWVLLFGPTDAKQELFNQLKENHLFNAIKIEWKQADKMTKNQQFALIKEYFAKPFLN
jgi:hypothetical protein